MRSEGGRAARPHVGTASFASSYLLMMSGGNLGGRLGWAAVSDRIGRRAAFLVRARIISQHACQHLIGRDAFCVGAVLDERFAGERCGVERLCTT